MTLKTDLNKLKKADLVGICTAQNLDVPKNVKTKAHYVKFMAGYSDWATPLETILAESGKVPAKKAKKSTKKAKAAAAPVGPSSDVLAKLQTMQSEISQLTGSVKTLKDEIGRLKSTLQSRDHKTAPAAVSASKSSSSAAPSPFKIIGGQMEALGPILEAIPEGEFTPLEDVFEFMEDIPKGQFKRLIKYLLMMRALDGEEAKGELQVDLDDGSVIGNVKR